MDNQHYKKHNKNKKRINELIKMVKKYNGLEYAIQKMKNYQQKTQYYGKLSRNREQKSIKFNGQLRG